MQTVEVVYLACSGLLAVSGLTMVALATRAYAQTNKRSMVHLSVGFALVVAAAVATALSAFMTEFQGVRSLLLVNSGFSSCGYLFVVYSLVSHD